MGSVCSCNTNEIDDDSLLIDKKNIDNFRLTLLYLKMKKLEENKSFHAPIWPDKIVN